MDELSTSIVGSGSGFSRRGFLKGTLGIGVIAGIAAMGGSFWFDDGLAFALAVIVVLIISALGFSLPLPLGVVGHEGSTVLVCLNGLRLLSFRA